MIIWLIGMSGSGKTTIGKQLYLKIKKKHPNTVFLDGDHIRSIMGNDLGHTIEDRRRNAERISRLCYFLDREGINVVTAILSIFHEWQDWNRSNFSKYFEVYLNVSMETLVKRDPKGLYKKAKKGEIENFVGFDIPFPPPKSPDMLVENDIETQDFQTIVDSILEQTSL